MIDRNPIESYEEKIKKHIKELENDIKGCENEIKRSKNKKDKKTEKYWSLLMKIFENTLKELKKIKDDFDKSIL